MNAASLDFRCLGVLVLVHDVLVDAIVHELVQLGFFPGLAERRQVLTGVAVQHQFIADHGIGVARLLLIFGELVLRHAH